MRSIVSRAVCLSLISSSVARVPTPHSYRDLIGRESQQHKHEVQTEENALVRWFKNLFSPAQRAVETTNVADTCTQDGYFQIVSESGPSLCQNLMNYANQTYTADFTPGSTYITVYTTKVSTDTDLERTTPVSTFTVTTIVEPSSSTPQITARSPSGMTFEKAVHEYNRRYRQRDVGATTEDNSASMSASMSAAYSSACSCQDYRGPTVTTIYTDKPTVTTVSAFVKTTTTEQSTKTAAAIVVTQTTTETASSSSSSSSHAASSTSKSEAAPSDSSSSSPATGSSPGTRSQTTSSSSAATPTTPPFSCPQDNNSTVSEMVGTERFDYRVLCDTVLMDSDLGSGTALDYSSFDQCVGACSIVNAEFDDPVCQGVVFYANVTGANGNCFLKESANSRNYSPGIDSAILERIAVAVVNSTVTSTEPAPFQGQSTSRDPAQVSSMLSSIFSNSSSNMPMITPGPKPVLSGMMVNPPYTAYSTYVSDGTTYSSGTGFTTATTYANGSWFSSFYTSYTVGWEASTAIYGATSGGYQLTNSTNSQTSQASGADGGSMITTITNTTSYFPGGYNVTEDIVNLGYAANGTQTYSSETVNHYTYQTAGADSGSVSSSAAGTPASASAATSTDVFSTMVYSSGGTGGVFSTAASGGPSPTAYSSATTIYNSYGTAYSTGYIVSGFISSSGSGGEASGAGSGSPGSTQISIETISFSSGGTQGALSGYTTGGPSSTPSPSVVSDIFSSGGTQDASSGFGSGGPSGTGSAPTSPLTVNVSSGGTQGASSGFGSGGPSGTGSIPTSPVSVVVSSGGTQGASSGFANGGPTGTGGASSSFVSGVTAPTSTGRFTNTAPPRQGTDSTTTNVTSTAPSTAESTSPLFGSSGAYSAPSASVAAPSGTAPSGTAPAGTGTSGTTPFSSASGGFLSGDLPPSPYPSSGTAPGTSPASESVPSNSASIPLLTTGGGYTGSLPSLSMSIPTAPASSGLFSYTGGLRSPFPTSGTAPLETGPLGTAPPATASGPLPSGPLPLNGTSQAIPSGTAPPYQPHGIYGPPIFVSHPWESTAPLSTSPVTDISSINGTAPVTSGFPSPTAPATCGNGTMGTTTVFVETTVYGCFSTCAPAGWGGYGAGPQSFGAPWTTSTSSA